MFTIIALVVSHSVVAVLAVLWGKRHPSTVISAVTTATAAVAEVKKV